MSDNQAFIPPLTISQMGRGRIYNDITETIGHTPLVRLSKIKEHFELQSDILMKLEFFNPLASVKDRIGLSMIDALMEEGTIGENTVLIEPTSGNTGIGLAFIAAARGLRLILVMPESMSIERRKMLTHLGAELVLTPAEKGMKGALEKSAEVMAQNPDSVMPSQFSSPANPAVHMATTAEEIWNDTHGNVDAIVAGVGTGGTITGCAAVWKMKKPKTKIVAVEPTDSPVLSGGDPGPHKIQGIGAGFVPSIVNKSLIDDVLTVSNEESFSTARLLARLEGIPGGISTGANLMATIKYIQENQLDGKTVVTFAPSFAERYMSTLLFEDPNETESDDDKGHVTI
jgi:cysteine synthase A